MEKVTAAVLITRREATAEASLARRRDLRKLGTAIAAMIRITVTTRSSSIRENPLWLRMSSPQAGASARGRGPQEFRPTRILSEQKTITLTSQVYQTSGMVTLMLWTHRNLPPA